MSEEEFFTIPNDSGIGFSVKIVRDPAKEAFINAVVEKYGHERKTLEWDVYVNQLWEIEGISMDDFVKDAGKHEGTNPMHRCWNCGSTDLELLSFRVYNLSDVLWNSPDSDSASSILEAASGFDTAPEDIQCRSCGEILDAYCLTDKDKGEFDDN